MSRMSFAAMVEVVEWEPPAIKELPLFPPAKRESDRREESISLAKLDAAAYARGFGEAQDQLRGEIEAVCESHRQELHAAIEAERRNLRDGEGAALASSLAGVIAEIEETIVEKVKPVLQGLLEAALVERATNELGQILRRAIAADGSVEVTIAASADLIEAVKKQLPTDWKRIVFVDSDKPGIRVSAGNCDMSVDLEAWRQLIKGGVL